MFQNRCYRCFKEKGNYQVCPYCGYIEGFKPEQDYQLMPGTLLAERYIIGVTIGVGGFGIIYKGYDTQENRIVAVKEFYPGKLVNRMAGESTINIFTGSQMDEYQRLRSQFEVEARVMEPFAGEPDLVNIKNYLEVNGTVYIVMEYIDGILLRDFLKMNGKMEERDAVSVAFDLLKAVEKIHTSGIVHRDISPDNIFLLENHGMKLFDFGSADRITGKKEKKEKKNGTVVKPGYAPPEQYDFQSGNTPEMDIYAVGAVLYEMVTGVRPLEGSARSIRDDLPDPIACGAAISESTSRIILKAMAVKPELRFSSAEEFAQALDSGKMVELPQAELKKKQHRRKIITGMAISLASICLIATVGLVAYFGMNNLADVTLKEDTLQVWVPVDQEGNVEGMINIWTEEYQKKYPEITVSAVKIPREEYSARLKEAAASGSLPDVFSTRDYEGDLEEICAGLKPLIRSLDTEKYLFYDSYQDYYPEMLELPTGFQIGVVYQNSLRMKEGKSSAQLADLLKETEGTLIWADEADMKGMYGKFAKEKENPNAIAGDLSVLKRVEKVTVEKVPAREFDIIPIVKENKLLGVFTDTWAVNKECTKNQKNAGMLLLSYLLEDVLQEEAYLASYDSIPVNKEAYNNFKKFKMTAKLSFLEKYEDNLELSPDGDTIAEAYGGRQEFQAETEEEAAD